MNHAKQKEIIEITINYVKMQLIGSEAGHDWWHVYRVWNTAKKIATEENANMFVVELAALLHDIADSKFNNGDETIGPTKTSQFLKSLDIEENTISQVVNIVKHISFKGGNEKQSYNSKELDIVQDADRLDAIGAIGIARTFHYGGYKNREIYNNEEAPNLQMTKEQYKDNTSHTINHFYEKLLLLKDLMNTKIGIDIAVERHRFLELYLKKFHLEWGD
jgi:uncharacterized protein